MRKPLFSLILIIPTALLLGLLIPFASNLVQFYSVPKDLVLSQLKDYLEVRSFENKIVYQSISKDDFSELTFVLGGSSVVLSHPDESKGEVFSFFLQSLWKESKVANLGREGVDSFYHRDLFKLALKEKPQWLIFYAGHNDYTNAYRNIVRPQFSLLKGTFVSWLVKRLDRFKGNPEWHLDYNLEPKALQLYSTLGLIEVDEEFYKNVDELIVRAFRENVLKIIDLSKKHKVKVLLISPISNLYIHPSGNQEMMNKFISSQKLRYSEKQIALKNLRDRDFLAPDIRAKEPLLDSLEALANPGEGIFYLSLEKELEKEQFEYDYDSIYDYFHFRRKFHKRVAKIIFKKLKGLK